MALTESHRPAPSPIDSPTPTVIIALADQRKDNSMYPAKLLWTAVLLPMWASAAVPPSPSELLDRYRQGLDRIHSYTCRTEERQLATTSDFEGVRTKNSTSLIRCDGARISIRTYAWGSLMPRPGGVGTEKDQAQYSSVLWDGKQYLSYVRSATDVGQIVINSRLDEQQSAKNRELAAMAGGPMLGYPGTSTHRSDVLLRSAKRISVRNAMSRVNGSDCYVLDAVTMGGKFTLWIDPAHGYLAAQYEVRVEEGDRWGDGAGPVEKGVSVLHGMKNVRFEQIDGEWIPVEADTVYDAKGHNGFFCKSQSHLECTEVVLDPDHDALGSFVPDDIREGAKVYVMGRRYPSGGPTETWRKSGTASRGTTTSQPATRPMTHPTPKKVSG
jgi:hypothetical protein